MIIFTFLLLEYDLMSISISINICIEDFMLYTVLICGIKKLNN